MHDFRDRFETLDGTRPNARNLSESLAKSHPMACFSLLLHGDAFQKKSPKARNDIEGAERFVNSHLTFHRPFSLLGRKKIADYKTQVKRDIMRQLRHSPALLARMQSAKKIAIDLVPQNAVFQDFGYPSNINPSVEGLFWDHPRWPKARIALREDALIENTTLVFHEMAHAIHYLALTKSERDLIYQHLKPTFGSPQAMDEAFAIYSERVFSLNFSDQEKRAPGVYGFVRREWEENHVFARFMALLYAPHLNADLKPLDRSSFQKFLS